MSQVAVTNVDHRHDGRPMSSTSKETSRLTKRAGAGYARSRWNAKKHGLAAGHVVIQGEDPEAFERLLQQYIDEWQPRGRTQERLIEELAAIDWKLTRYARVEQAYHRQTLAAGSEKNALALSDIDAGIDGLVYPRRSASGDRAPSAGKASFDDGFVPADPDALKEMQRYLRRLLDFRSRDTDSLKLAVFHLPPRFRDLWEMACEDPLAFSRFMRSRDLADVTMEEADWPNFSVWVKEFAIPYLNALFEVHAKALDHQQHMTELMNLTAMEGLESIWRYEDRLHAQRKNALAVLLRLQGR